MSEYKIVTFWSEKDQSYVAICPDFEGLAVVGKTREAATKEAEAAIEAYIEIYKEDGIPIPSPSSIQPEYSGQVRLRMARSVHQRAVELAEAEGISLNSFLSGAVEARLAVQNFHNRLLKEIADSWATVATVSIENNINSLSISANTLEVFGDNRRPPVPISTQRTTKLLSGGANV